jgi:hypothetical protein
MSQLDEWFVRESSINAALSWFFLGIILTFALAGVAVEQFVVAGFAVAIVVVGLAPVAATESWRTMLPFPFLFVAALPLAVSVYSPDVATDLVTALSIATLSLLVVVDLHLLTAVRMTAGFATSFVVIATMATAGFWAVGAGFAHYVWGTAFVQTNRQLMGVFVAATVGGLVAGAVFRWYFRRRERAGDHVTEEAGYA